MESASGFLGGLEVHPGFEAIMAASYSKRLISTNLRSDFLQLLQQNCILVSNYSEY